MIEIRRERPDDVGAIREVNARAFGAPVEARLVDLLRARGQAVISLVAQRGDQVVGHILFSPVTITNRVDEAGGQACATESLRAVGLAPMSVLPEFQNQGIGSRLVRVGLAACQVAGYDIVVVLGHVAFYPRFGFATATDYGLQNEYDATDAFMVLALRQGALDGISGLVKYAPEFHEVGF